MTVLTPTGPAFEVGTRVALRHRGARWSHLWLRVSEILVYCDSDGLARWLYVLRDGGDGCMTVSERVLAKLVAKGEG